MRRVAALLVAASVGAGCGGEERAPRAGGPPSSEVPPGAAPAAPTTAASTAATRAPTAPPSGHPDSVAAAIVSAEGAIRDRTVPVSQLEAPARAQQEAYRLIVEHPEWADAVLAKVPPALHDTVRANVRAGAELRALNRPRTTLPNWRIVPPAPAEELLGHYKDAGRRTGVPWPYLASIHLVETRMGRIRGTSVAGAQGPMQFLPSTWQRYGKGDINSNHDAILAAARLLASNGAPARMDQALFRYNPSQRYVTAVKAYAQQMEADERAYLGYYHWQVYYRMVDGDRLLPVGYGT